MRSSLTRSLIAPLAVIFALTGCSEITGNDGEAARVNVSGNWTGQFTHPGWDGGFLTLRLTQLDNVVTGEYQLRLAKRHANGRTQVQQYSGRVLGASVDNRHFEIVLQRRDGTWTLDAVLDGRNQMAGPWRSGRITGTFDVER